MVPAPTAKTCFPSRSTNIGKYDMPASNSSFHIPLIIHKITFFSNKFIWRLTAWDLACILEENIGRERKGSMEEVFRAIEDKIRETGYDGLIDGETFYDEICDEIEDKEVGSYLFMSKRDNGDIFEYKVDVMEDQFNLSYVTITSGDRSFHADFD